jgi:hypothetical protein
VAAGRDARHEVLAAAANDRARIWVINRLLNPKFDDPDAQMPNLNLPRDKAEALATQLLGPSRTQRALAIVTSNPRFLQGAAAGAVATALLAAMIVLLRRPMARILRRGTRPGRPERPQRPERRERRGSLR